MKAALPRLEAALRQALEGAGGRTPALAALPGLVFRLRHDLEAHLRNEEMVLFPAIAECARAEAEGAAAPELAFGTLDRPIGRMENEHEDVREMLRRIREVTRDHAAGGQSFALFYAELDAFEADLDRHLELETEVLFPRAGCLERRPGHVR